MKSCKQIVIIGAGFGGVYTLKYLQKKWGRMPDVRITLIDNHNYFLFTPLLHEVATGNQSSINVVESIRKVLSSCIHNFHHGNVERIDFKKKTIYTSAGELSYDYVVMASGSKTDFRGVKGAREYAKTLKSLEDAVSLKNHFIQLFESASLAKSVPEKKKLLTFVVVGGGPTGVELAAEMKELFCGTMKIYYPSSLIEKVSLYVIQKPETLIPNFPKSFQAKSLQALKKMGINVLFETNVVEVGRDYTILDSGEKIETATVIWTAGVMPNMPSNDLFSEKKIEVNSYLQAVDHPTVFALGDVAAFRQEGINLPATAQVATRQAKILAENLYRHINNKNLIPFVYRHSGDLLSLGKWNALGSIGGVTIKGPFAWWLWRTVYLSKILSWKKKIRVVVDWTLNIFSSRDISEL